MWMVSLWLMLLSLFLAAADAAGWGRLLFGA